MATHTTDDSTRRSTVQAVDRAMMLLQALQGHRGTRTVLDLSEQTGIDRTVAHRLLKTLSRSAMVVEESGAYGLGPEAVLLANSYVDSMRVRRIALPYMLEMQSHDIAGSPWTVSLSIPVGAVSAVIERIWTPTTPLDIVLSSGDSFPLAATATGRSILAHYSDQKVVETVGPDAVDELRPILDEVRRSGGVGISHGEAIVGVDGIAAAIQSADGTPVASLGVSGVDLGDQLTPDSRLAHKLRRNALAIGRMLR
ncbi:IclR family transcriptional regulator [Nocardia sp. NBC_00416]|uniref:IclR family transcriptional regulator n=1 Tax=Nocardia sp. NBC_00416 TaxID=2975991 RepID=UPI002E1AC406